MTCRMRRPSSSLLGPMLIEQLVVFVELGREVVLKVTLEPRTAQFLQTIEVPADFAAHIENRGFLFFRQAQFLQFQRRSQREPVDVRGVAVASQSHGELSRSPIVKT